MSSTRRMRPRGGRLIYAASETCPDLLYATGLIAPDPFLWFSVRARSGVVVSALEVGRVRKQIRPGVRVLSYHEARSEWNLSNARLSPDKLIAGLAQHERIINWQVPEDFPLGLGNRLTEVGLRLSPVKDFFPERRCKSEAEVDCVREGVALAEAGLERAFAVLRESSIRADSLLEWRGEVLSAELLRGEIDAEIARRGGSASHTITAPGPQAADPHVCGCGPIHAGVPIVMDIFPRVDRAGYFGDLTRTVVKGRAPKTVRDAFKAVRKAQRAAIHAVRAGVRACTVHRAAADVLAAAGYETELKADPPRGFIHGTGHGLGLDIHEAPRVAAREQTRLADGNVVTIEPGLYYPEWGGVRLEDVVVVRPGACLNLTSADVFLEID